MEKGKHQSWRHSFDRCWRFEDQQSRPDPRWEITAKDLKSSGLSQPDLKAILDRPGALYRIEFELVGSDPRIELRESKDLSAREVEEIKTKLDRWDRSSTRGSWTSATLKTIADNPGLRALQLATQLGFDKNWFKIQVRKLKNMGLTESLEVGYRISPRGSAFLKASGS